MEARIGPLSAEVTYGESERFTSPLLLVHGLWDDPSVWRRFTGFLTHRGWHCIAVHLPNHPHRGVGESLALLGEAIASLDATPVVVGHDFGGLLALGARAGARAVAALAPLVPLPAADAPPAALRHAGNWLSRRFRSTLSAPRGPWRRSYPARFGAAEPARLIGALQETVDEINFVPSAVPALVVAGENDPVVPLGTARRLAERAGADFQGIVGGGHALPVDGDWQACVSSLHRWIVQRLGASLLEFYEESEDE
jgi:pimeloyl-ACP methyl ester carboxylesterase